MRCNMRIYAVSVRVLFRRRFARSCVCMHAHMMTIARKIWGRADVVTMGTYYLGHNCLAVGCPGRGSRRPGLGWCWCSNDERFCTCRFCVKSSFLNFWSNDIWLNAFSWNKVVRGCSTFPTNGTRSEKVWQTLI